MRKNILVPRDSAPFGHTKNRDLWKSAIHGFPATLRIRVKSDNLIGWEYETIALGMLRKPDFPRGRDSWCWPKESRPLGTRMEQKDKPLINAGWPSHFTRGIQFFILTKTTAAQGNEIVVSDKNGLHFAILSLWQVSTLPYKKNHLILEVIYRGCTIWEAPTIGRIYIWTNYLLETNKPSETGSSSA